MSRSKIGIVARWSCLPLLIIIFILLAELRSLRRETQSLRTATEDGDKKVSSLLNQIAEAKTHKATSATSTASEKKPTKPRSLRRFSDINAMADPKYGAPILRRQRRYAMANYRAAIDAMHLSLADEQRLKELVVTRWNAAMDAKDVLDRLGETSRSIRDNVGKTVRADADREIKNFLNEEAFAQFEATHEQSTAKTNSSGLVTELWDAGFPLTSEQQDALALQIQAQYSRPEEHNSIDPKTGLREKDKALLDSVESFLTPEQVAFIRDEMLADAHRRALEEIVSHKKPTSSSKP